MRGASRFRLAAAQAAAAREPRAPGARDLRRRAGPLHQQQRGTLAQVMSRIIAATPARRVAIDISWVAGSPAGRENRCSANHRRPNRDSDRAAAGGPVDDGRRRLERAVLDSGFRRANSRARANLRIAGHPCSPVVSPPGPHVHGLHVTPSKPGGNTITVVSPAPSPITRQQ